MNTSFFRRIMPSKLRRLFSKIYIFKNINSEVLGSSCVWCCAKSKWV